MQIFQESRQPVVNFLILALPYKSTQTFVDIFSGVKGRLIRHNLGQLKYLFFCMS